MFDKNAGFNLLTIVAKSMLVSSTVFVILALLVLPVGCDLPFGGWPPAPSPSPTPSDDREDSEGTQSAILGTVTDLSTGQPGTGIKVAVSGFPPVRTDSDGRYAVTGLPAGEYSVSLEPGSRGTSAQGPVFVNVDGQNNATLDLAYSSQPQPLPTDTPQPAVAAAVTPQPTVAAAVTPRPALPKTGTPIGHGPLVVVGLGLLLTLVGGALRLGIKQP